MIERLKPQDLTDNEKINCILNRIYRHQLRCDKRLAQLQANFDQVYKKIQDCYKELNFADLLHDTIINSIWLKDKTFSLHGWAANYSFIYMLYRILDSVRPEHILEMGMGQTSRLTSQYVAYGNPNATVDIIENDAGWIATYQPQLAQCERAKVHQCDLDFFKYGKTECRKYKDLQEVSANNRYDLIIIDGPWGANQDLPRSNILDLIKNHCVADDFIIIFDDAERIGEQNTIEQTKNLLIQQGIEFSTLIREGLKRQLYLTSISKQFIQYL